jgi:integrase
MATYGLRNHEVFRLNFSAYPKVYVERGKTGKRLVLPLYPEWAEIWQLWDVKTPDIVNIEEQANNKLGIKVSGWFYNNKAPFSAYNLRHCYARRCFEFGIAPDRAAKLMGHSLAIHLKTYRAWFDEEVYLKEYQRVISDINRPLPPGLT